MALKGDVKTKKGGFRPGFGMIVELVEELPRKYDSAKLGSEDAKGYPITAKVVAVIGTTAESVAPAVGSLVNVVIRPDDNRKSIFDDMEKTREASRFFLEGVSGEYDALEAGWVHGAGDNREIASIEIVGPPSVTFENPVLNDGPKNGMLRLHLDGSPTTYSERLSDGEWVEHSLSYDDVVGRLKTALERNMSFRVTQRALFPSLAEEVGGQEDLEKVLAICRKMGYTSCVVRTFLPGTTDPRKVDVQVLSWPEDIPGENGAAPKVFEMPTLRETKRFAALRDGDEVAVMEIIPGYELNLVGNPSDTSKSVKHKFVNDIVGKGHSSSQKNFYGASQYGPGVAIRAKNADGEVLGLTRFCTRTEGPQYRGLATIPSAVFPEANKLDFSKASMPPAEKEAA